MTAAAPEDLSPAGVAACIAGIARQLDRDQQSLSRALTDQLAQEIEALDADADPVLHELLLASVDGNVKTILHVLLNDIPVAHLTPSTAAVEYALRLAQRGIPSSALMRAYHMGQDGFRRAAIEAIRDSDLSAEMRLAVNERVSSTLYDYIDAITQLLLAMYEQERDRWSSAQGNVLASYIHAVLSERTVDRAAFATATSYHLDQCHLGVIVWTDHDDPGAEEQRALETTVRQFAVALKARGQVLYTAVDRSTAWAWIPLGTTARLPARPWSDYRPANHGHRIALGLPSAGETGFRRSHEQAESARTLALMAPARTGAVVGFDGPGVAATALLAQQAAATREWVHAVLGPLASDDDAHESLRETLRIFLAAGENIADTAAALVVHRNTVRYRISRALEERQRALGRTLDVDRLDVALALQAAHYLGSLVLTPAEEPSG